jgi:SAM-dependent methyltransferase
MAEDTPESLERIKAREREAMRLAGIQTMHDGYGFLRSNISNYDEHLFPGEESVFDVIREIYARTGTPVRVLDFGCGTGEALRGLKHRLPDVPLELVGVSIEDPRDEYDRKKDQELGITYIAVSPDPTLKPSGPNGEPREHMPKASFVAGEGEKFDLIVTRFALQHVPDVLRVLRGLYQSLTPGGVMHAHIGEYTGKERFAERTDSIPTYEDYAFAQADFDKVINDLKDSGIDLERHYPPHPEVLVIRKNEVQMKFPNLRYDLDGTQTGRMYRREEP